MQGSPDPCIQIRAHVSSPAHPPRQSLCVVGAVCGLRSAAVALVWEHRHTSTVPMERAIPERPTTTVPQIARVPRRSNAVTGIVSRPKWQRVTQIAVTQKSRMIRGASAPRTPLNHRSLAPLDRGLSLRLKRKASKSRYTGTRTCIATPGLFRSGGFAPDPNVLPRGAPAPLIH